LQGEYIGAKRTLARLSKKPTSIARDASQERNTGLIRKSSKKINSSVYLFFKKSLLYIIFIFNVYLFLFFSSLGLLMERTGSEAKFSESGIFGEQNDVQEGPIDVDQIVNDSPFNLSIRSFRPSIASNNTQINSSAIKALQSSRASRRSTQSRYDQSLSKSLSTSLSSSASSLPSTTYSQNILNALDAKDKADRDRAAKLVALMLQKDHSEAEFDLDGGDDDVIEETAESSLTSSSFHRQTPSSGGDTVVHGNISGSDDRITPNSNSTAHSHSPHSPLYKSSKSGNSYAETLGDCDRSESASWMSSAASSAVVSRSMSLDSIHNQEDQEERKLQLIKLMMSKQSQNKSKSFMDSLEVMAKKAGISVSSLPDFSSSDLSSKERSIDDSASSLSVSQINMRKPSRDSDSEYHSQLSKIMLSMQQGQSIRQQQQHVVVEAVPIVRQESTKSLGDKSMFSSYGNFKTETIDSSRDAISLNDPEVNPYDWNRNSNAIGSSLNIRKGVSIGKSGPHHGTTEELNRNAKLIHLLMERTDSESQFGDSQTFEPFDMEKSESKSMSMSSQSLVPPQKEMKTLGSRSFVSSTSSIPLRDSRNSYSRRDDGSNSSHHRIYDSQYDARSIRSSYIAEEDGDDIENKIKMTQLLLQSQYNGNHVANERDDRSVSNFSLQSVSRSIRDTTSSSHKISGDGTGSTETIGRRVGQVARVIDNNSNGTKSVRSSYIPEDDREYGNDIIEEDVANELDTEQKVKLIKLMLQGEQNPLNLVNEVVGFEKYVTAEEGGDDESTYSLYSNDDRESIMDPEEMDRRRQIELLANLLRTEHPDLLSLDPSESYNVDQAADAFATMASEGLLEELGSNESFFVDENLIHSIDSIHGVLAQAFKSAHKTKELAKSIHSISESVPDPELSKVPESNKPKSTLKASEPAQDESVVIAIEESDESPYGSSTLQLPPAKSLHRKNAHRSRRTSIASKSDIGIGTGFVNLIAETFFNKKSNGDGIVSPSGIKRNLSFSNSKDSLQLASMGPHMKTSQDNNPSQQQKQLSQNRFDIVTPIEAITLTSLLDGEHEFPYTVANFYQFLLAEHSEENYEFYKAAVAFTERANELLQVIEPPEESNTKDSGSFHRASSTIRVHEKGVSTSSETESQQSTLSHHSPDQFNLSNQSPTSQFDIAHHSLQRSTSSGTSPHDFDLLSTTNPSEKTALYTLADSLASLSAHSSFSHLDVTEFDNPKSILNSTFAAAQSEKQSKLESSLRQELEEILKTYIRIGSPKEINLPHSIRKKLLAEDTSDARIFKTILKPASGCILTLMKTSSFPHFMKETQAKYGPEGEKDGGSGGVSPIGSRSRSDSINATNISVPGTPSMMDRRKSEVKESTWGTLIWSKLLG